MSFIYTQNCDLEAFSGDDFDIPLAFTTGYVPDTIAINITGWTLEFLIKNYETDLDSEAVVFQTVTTHLDPVNGISAFINSQSVTSTLTGRYYYYMRYFDTAGNRQTFLYGKINFLIQESK